MAAFGRQPPAVPVAVVMCAGASPFPTVPYYGYYPQNSPPCAFLPPRAPAFHISPYLHLHSHARYWRPRTLLTKHVGPGTHREAHKPHPNHKLRPQLTQDQPHPCAWILTPPRPQAAARLPLTSTRAATAPALWWAWDSVYVCLCHDSCW